MNSDNLKEQIEKILLGSIPVNYDHTKPAREYINEATNQLLQLYKDYAMGCVPKMEWNETNSDEYEYNLGYNQARQDILDNLKGKK